VRLFVGECLTEHADTFTALIGLDQDALYLLDSPSMFRLLLHRHPARVPSDAAGLLQYSWLALRMSGYSYAGSRFVKHAEDVPEVIAREAGLTIDQVRVSQVEFTPQGVRVIHLTTLEPEGIAFHDLLVGDDGDFTIVGGGRTWEHQGPSP